jgi:hypothetical protein
LNLSYSESKFAQYASSSSMKAILESGSILPGELPFFNVLGEGW